MAFMTMACYHHANCGDRPSVSTCSKCGKGLCTECTDKLRSKKTGKILCVDCLNAELRSMENHANYVIAKRKKELIGMLVGGIIGLILAIALTGTLGVFAWFIPFACASFATIWGRTFGSGAGLIWGIISFLIGVVISPIVLVVRVVSRLKESKDLKAYAEYLGRAKVANNNYFKMARAMKTGGINEELEKLAEERKKLQAQLQAAQAAKSDNADALAAIEELKKKVAAHDSQIQEVKDSEEKQANELQNAMAGLEDLGSAVDKMSGKKAHKAA